MVHIRIFLRIGNKERQLLEGVIEYAFEDKVIIESTSNDHILDNSSQCQNVRYRIASLAFVMSRLHISFLKKQ